MWSSELSPPHPTLCLKMINFSILTWHVKEGISPNICNSKRIAIQAFAQLWNSLWWTLCTLSLNSVITALSYSELFIPIPTTIDVFTIRPQALLSKSRHFDFINRVGLNIEYYPEISWFCYGRLLQVNYIFLSCFHSSVLYGISHQQTIHVTKRHFIPGDVDGFCSL